MTEKPTYEALEKRVQELEKIGSEQKLVEEGIKHNEKITTTLFSISNSVNTTDNLDDLYRSIYDSLNQIIGLPNFFIAIVDSKKNQLNFPFFVDEHDTQQTISTGLEKYKESTSNTSRVISTKKPYSVKIWLDYRKKLFKGHNVAPGFLLRQQSVSASDPI